MCSNKLQLDMLDLNHHLGLHLPTIGAESPSTVYALHALSARHRELASGVPDMAQFESERYYNMSKWGSGAIRPVDMADTLEARIIRLIVDLISSPLSSWTRHLEQGTALITPLYSYALKSGLPASLFWCVFRFDLAAALVNETSMATDLEAIFPQEGLPDGLSSPFDDPGPNDNLGPNCVDQYALRALYLCGKAVRVLHDHRQREAGDERPRPQNHLMQWQSTWSELATWYTGRHRFVKPLLELSLSAHSSDSSPHAEPPPAFPTVIFTTAAATLANLAYHTAATILLDCKPKTLKMPGQQLAPAAMRSPHWHAQRTCAIAVANAGVDDGGGTSWDPCVVACVLHAARKMTHRDQQAAVLETLGRGRDATGWRIEGELQRLQEFWRLAEHA
ncbi:c6 zinc finger domain-containing protein [Neofusicoccum parvum]|nr:c6 zinc finger domain-containing protein [Neofusicoccum parvum]